MNNSLLIQGVEKWPAGFSETPIDYALFGGIVEKYKRHPVQVRDPFLLESGSV